MTSFFLNPSYCRNKRAARSRYSALTVLSIAQDMHNNVKTHHAGKGARVTTSQHIFISRRGGATAVRSALSGRTADALSLLIKWLDENSI